MKTKWVFIVIVLFITAVFMTLGFLFFRNEPFPFWAMQCIAVASVLFSIFLYKKLVKPYLLILNGMELLKEQDFSTHLRPVKNKDANELIDIFNRMITHLRNERLQVRERNQFLDLLINASPQGIIILNFDKQITDINTAGLKLLGLHDLDEVKGKRFVDANFPLAPALAGLKLKDDMILRGEGATVYRCVYSSFVDQGFNHPFVLIEELTNELLRIEKESYERIIRMMSHEVNNSVGAIGSTLNVVSDIFRQERGKEMEDVLFAVDASYDRCRNLTEFISDLANIIRIPEPSLSTVSLNEQIRAIEGVIRLECQRRNIRLSLSLDKAEPMIRIDGVQFEQVLLNIAKNAYEAVGEEGEIRITTFSSPLSIVIEDNGNGIDEEAREKLFTPFYTTKSAGQGIGLMFVREVLINHGCRFSLTSQDGWTRFEIVFAE